MLRRRLVVLSAATALCATAAAVAVTGCGSTTVHHVTTTITRSATGAGTTTSTSSTTSAGTTSSATSTTSHATAGGRSALAGRSPREVLTLAAAALRRSGGYAMRADLVQDRRRTVIDLSAAGARRYQASLTTGSTMFQLVTRPGAAYLRGNQAFWRTQLEAAAGGGGADGGLARTRARQLAGHWLHVPAASARSVTRSLGTLTPGTLARCLTEDHGTLSVSGRTTVDGTPALVVRDAGNAPGSTPSTIAVAADGAPYPLRYDATGATRRGGRVDVCNDGRGDGATGTIDLSQFGHTPAVQAPSAAGGGAPV